MRKRSDFAQEFRDTVGERMSDDHAHYLTELFSKLLDEYAFGVSEELERKYREWEEVMEADDPSLYTLGLRHAKDLLLEQNFDERSATLATQYERELEDSNENDQPSN